MSDLYYFLGIVVTHLQDSSVPLCQRKYVLDLLDRCHMVNSKFVHTPIVSSSFLSKDTGSPISNPSEYHSITGAL